MALTDVTISFDLSQLLGGDFDTRRTKAYVTTNVENGTLMDTSTGETRLGDQTVTINSDGTGEFTTWAIGADGNPISWQTTLVVDYPRTGQRDRQTRRFGPYTIEASHDGDNITDLEEEQAVPAEYLTQVTEALQEYVDTVEEISGLTGEDEAVAFLVGDEDSETRDALEVEFVRPSGKTASGYAARLPSGNALDYEVKFDGRTLADGEITSGSNELYSPSYEFTTANIGQKMKVTGAGPGGTSLKTTIEGVSLGRALLADDAATTVNGTPGQAVDAPGNVIFGTDDTDKMHEFLNALVTYVTDDSPRSLASVRRGRLPQGMSLIRQIVQPRRLVLRAAGWGNYTNIYGNGFEQTNNTMLYQLWDVNDDAIIFTESSTGVDYVINDIADFSLQQDLDNTSGSGIVYRNAAGTPLAWSDGNRAENIAVYGFAEHGWKIPAGMVPGHMVNNRGMVCGGAGLYMRMAPNGSISDIDNFSADCNGQGAIYLKGGGGTTTIGVVKIRSLKYEDGENFYRGGIADERYAISLDSMGGAHVDVDGCDVVAGASESAAPDGAIQVTDDAQTAIVTGRAVSVRVLDGQTGTPVTLRDHSYNAAVGADRPLGNNLIDFVWTTGGNPRGTRIAMTSGGNLRDVAGWYDWYGTANENPGHQLVGEKPVYSLVNLQASADRRQNIITVDADGKLVFRSIKNDGSTRDILSMRPGATFADDRIAFDIAPRLADRASMIGPRMTVGTYYIQPYISVNGGTGTLTQNEVYWIPWPIGRDCVLDRLAFRIIGAGSASSVIRYGLRADDGEGRPGTLLLQDTTAADVTNTTRTLTISQAASRGLVHVGLCLQGGTGATIAYGNRSHPLVGSTDASSVLQGFVRCHMETGVTGAFATNPTLIDPASATNTRDFVVALRASA